MYNIGEVERHLYKLRSEHPVIIPQLDPDRYTSKSAGDWFKQVEANNLSVIAFGGSIMDSRHAQEILNIALKDFDFKVLMYLTGNSGAIKGLKNRVGLYWMQVPNALIDSMVGMAWFLTH